MFGDNAQQQMPDSSGMTMNDQGQPGFAQNPQPMVDHQMTPAYGDAPMAPTQDSQQAMPAQSDEHPGDSELLGIKQDALNALSPLVPHLEQNPEEKFRTTMMLIQASDDRSLVRSAYEAAQAITDDKVRAQALLDVINEINYFTSHSAQQ